MNRVEPATNRDAGLPERSVVANPPPEYLPITATCGDTTNDRQELGMGNPEKGPGSLGANGSGNAAPKPTPAPPPGLGSTAVKGAGVSTK